MMLDLRNEIDFFSNKSVLITGGTGFIGSALVRLLANSAKEVHVIARKESNLYRIASTLDFTKIHYVPLAGTLPLLEQLPDIHPDIIFHLAEPSNGKLKTTDDFIELQQESLRMTANILEYARATKVEKLIHACSSFIYGNNGLTLVNENSPYQPDTFRGMIKLSERNLCKYYSEEYEVPVVLARIFRAYGPYDSNKKLITRCLELHRNNKQIDMVTDTFVRDYIHVDDIILSMTRMCRTSLAPGEEFNIGSGQMYNARQIVQHLEEILGADNLISGNVYAVSKIDHTIKSADISKAKRILKWQPQIDILTGLKGVVSWYQTFDY